MVEIGYIFNAKELVSDRSVSVRSFTESIEKRSDADGSYLCECYPGYNGDGKYQCRDINECKLIIHVETDDVTGEDINYG